MILSLENLKLIISECRDKSIEFFGDVEKNNINYYLNKIKTDRIKIKL